MDDLGYVWISSNMIAGALGLTPSTIRQDIQYLGKVRSSSFGYSARDFREVLEETLGIKNGAFMAIVGVGGLGSALARYEGFRSRDFIVKALFDRNPGVKSLMDIPCYPLDRMPEIVAREHITIGIITTPAGVAQQVADVMADSGIKGIWNFAPITLRTTPELSIENVNLCPSLFSLAFKIKNG